jgi:hypothetical protein
MTMRFLEGRDQDFDIVKTFLVISMVIAHAFQWFYIPIYNKNLTYYVLIGFVFLSGLTVGGVYQERFLTKPSTYTWAILLRAMKLLGIFLFANALIILLYPAALWQARNLPLTDLLASALLRDEAFRFSFSVLVAISFTFVGSVALLRWRRCFLDPIFLGFGISALWIIEITGHFDYYTVKMTIVGLIGVLSGKILGFFEWEKLKTALSKWYLAIWTCYVAYQAALLAFNTEWRLLVGHYINVTIFLLLAVYLTSYHLGLGYYKVFGLLNRSLAKHMLFAYIFHLMFLRVLTKVTSRGDIYFAIGISLLTLWITIVGGLLIDVSTARYKTLNRTYSLIFR